jgi:hypothetical protein
MKVNQSALARFDSLAEIHEILVTALGGEDAVPEGVSTVNLAHAAASQLGGFRGGLRSAARVSGKWADELTAYIADAGPSADVRVVAVRDALNRHRPVDEETR